jgi:hypothetical protein
MATHDTLLSACKKQKEAWALPMHIALVMMCLCANKTLLIGWWYDQGLPILLAAECHYLKDKRQSCAEEREAHVFCYAR